MTSPSVGSTPSTIPADLQPVHPETAPDTNPAVAFHGPKRHVETFSRALPQQARSAPAASGSARSARISTAATLTNGSGAANAPANALAPRQDAPAGQEPPGSSASGILPDVTREEFENLALRYDTEEGYLQRRSGADMQNAQKIEDGLDQELTGYPAPVIQFQQRLAHVQGMLAQLPDSERQFYAGVLATMGAAYQLETSLDKRYAIGQKMTSLENAIRDESTRVLNDPVERVLSQFNPPMGVAYLSKEDRQNVDLLARLRDDFMAAPDAGEREKLFQQATAVQEKLQDRISVEIGKRQRTGRAQWKEANGEVDRILKEARAQTDPAKRYELIGRQLYQSNPGYDDLKDKVVLAFTQRMRDSPELRDLLDTWHSQVSGPLNAHSVGAAKRYTDILKQLPPVSGDYVRDLSDRYNAVLHDTSDKNYSIQPSVRAAKLAAQIMEGIERVLLGLTPLAPLADALPSTLPDNVRMGLDYGSAYLGLLSGEAWGALKEISIAGRAASAAGRDAELSSLAGRRTGTAGGDLMRATTEGVIDGTRMEQSLSQQARAAERALFQQTLDNNGPLADPNSLLAHRSVERGRYASFEPYADANVSRGTLRPGPTPGILVDERDGRYIDLAGKLYHVRFDKDNGTWRVFMKDNPLKPQYPVTFDATTRQWSPHDDVGLAGGAPKMKPEVRQEIIRLLKEGELPRTKIAEKMGVSPATVLKIAKSEGIGLAADASLRSLPLTPATRATIIKQIQDGELSYREIGRRLDISQVTVSKIAKQIGAPKPHVQLSLMNRDVPGMLKLLREGKMSYQEIANQFNVSRGSVARLAKKHDITLPAAISLRNLKVTPEIEQQITQLLREGTLTQREIAAKFNVSDTTVYNLATRKGIAPPKPQGVTPELVSQVFSLKNEGKTNAEIADTLKLTERKVQKIYAHYNSQTAKKTWWDTSPENRTTAIAMLDAGKGPSEVARTLKIPVNTVEGIANQHRAARDTLIRELLAQGQPPDTVAETLGVSRSYVMQQTRGEVASTHDLHFTVKERDAVMDMFAKGYSKEDVAHRAGISPWKVQSLANEFRTQTMGTVSQQQLNDVAGALNNQDYTFTTVDLAKATGLPESTIALMEHEYAEGFVIRRPQSPQAGPSWAQPATPPDRYEWVRPLSPAQQIEAIREVDDGRSLKEVAEQLQQPYAAVERLYEADDVPLVAPYDDAEGISIADHVAPSPSAFSADDQAEIRKLAESSGLSPGFIATLFNTTEAEIRKILG
ncbi:helix-turn-helix domain-containing protein [Paraburkholderia sp. BCC1886]|uniref:helix-turn-helix domain-containing protein n=1 Tax=Paraburkholderia sp. BCC1886 TaxID=2562670 RepID=UPI0011834086|nr:helix-turn-helix domain-containing protein [Paraburkholderia sp. BCC1886]